MDLKTQRRLNEINRNFYTVTAVEFSATRQSAWQGWRRMLHSVELPVSSVLDIGCGNGRFGRFLAEGQEQAFVYYGIDSSSELLAVARRQLADLPQLQLELVEQDIVIDQLPTLQAQLVVLFGLLHHVPSAERRQSLMRSVAESVLPGGTLVFAAWRFFEQERFRQRIVPWPADIDVEKHDYLLDWRRGERALRYCHYIDDDENAQLIDATGLTVINDYRADGAAGNLNRYTVLRKN